MTPTPDPQLATPLRARLAEVARLFTWLGFTAFGGPAVHIALMEEEVVRRRGGLAHRRHCPVQAGGGPALAQAL